MNRNDERKQVERSGHTLRRSGGDDEFDTGVGSGVAGVANTPRASRRAAASNVREHVHREADDPMRQVEEEGEDDSLERAPGGTRRGEAREMKEEHEEELGERGTVRGGREIMHEKVEADHVIGDGGSKTAYSAEGQVDGESSKAERKEAMEPERAANEHAATRGERTVPSKNHMGWGERETVAKHTI